LQAVVGNEIDAEEQEEEFEKDIVRQNRKLQEQLDNRHSPRTGTHDTQMTKMYSEMHIDDMPIAPMPQSAASVEMAVKVPPHTSGSRPRSGITSRRRHRKDGKAPLPSHSEYDPDFPDKK
jgi:hypothetical protein